MATRSLFILSALAGLTTAGPCKPGSSSSVFPDDVATINTLTGTISLSTTKASAPTVATTDETLLGSDTTALISYSMDVTSTTSLATEFSSDTTTDTTETTGADPTADPTTDTTLTTLWTSLASTETTTEPATTTSEASVPELTCPDARGMCFGTIEIKCNYAAFGDFRQLEGVSTLRRCVVACQEDSACNFFVLQPDGICNLSVDAQVLARAVSADYITGFKDTCGQGST